MHAGEKLKAVKSLMVQKKTKKQLPVFDILDRYYTSFSWRHITALLTNSDCISSLGSFSLQRVIFSV